VEQWSNRYISRKCENIKGEVQAWTLELVEIHLPQDEEAQKKMSNRSGDQQRREE
jgi:hypothetical protein